MIKGGLGFGDEGRGFGEEPACQRSDSTPRLKLDDSRVNNPIRKIDALDRLALQTILSAKGLPFSPAVAETIAAS
ncbi:MAG: hypothetical protein Kow0040_09970 [Thermogutta sp.]